MSDPIVIVSAARTPIGGMLGDFASLQAPQLGAVAIRAAMERAGIAGAAVDEVLFGCCLMAGQGQAPARQAALAAGAPHLLVGARKGYRYGAFTTFDHMALDGLEDAYERGKAMGVFAEQCVSQYGFTREAQDRFAIASLERSVKANNDGSFAWEIAPVTIAGKTADVSGQKRIDKDEQPFKARPDKIPGLRPAFKKDGTITAANASSISDGAAALVMMRASTAEQLGARPLARVLAHSVHAQAPDWFTTAPVGAIGKVLEKTGWKADEVDLWEINEAFAAVTMAAMVEHKLPHEKVNIHGGACALGHPRAGERAWLPRWASAQAAWCTHWPRRRDWRPCWRRRPGPSAQSSGPAPPICSTWRSAWRARRWPAVARGGPARRWPRRPCDSCSCRGS